MIDKYCVCFLNIFSNLFLNAENCIVVGIYGFCCLGKYCGLALYLFSFSICLLLLCLIVFKASE